VCNTDVPTTRLNGLLSEDRQAALAGANALRLRM
jgi:hypothetical protein